jgi:hypothetical protein
MFVMFLGKFFIPAAAIAKLQGNTFPAPCFGYGTRADVDALAL